MIPEFIAIAGSLIAAKILADKKEPEVTAQPEPSPTIVQEKEAPDAAAIKQIITEEANKQGLNPKIALLFAFLETRFSNQLGDSKWPFRRDKATGRTNWDKFVLNSENLKYNPFIDQKELWISYGPFQVLSAYHLQKIDPNADPRILADIRTNAFIAVKIILNLQKLYKGDLKKMRLAYVCGNLTASNPNGYCKPDTAALHLYLLSKAAPKYGLYV